MDPHRVAWHGSLTLLVVAGLGCGDLGCSSAGSSTGVASSGNTAATGTSGTGSSAGAGAGSGISASGVSTGAAAMAGASGASAGTATSTGSSGAASGSGGSGSGVGLSGNPLGDGGSNNADAASGSLGGGSGSPGEGGVVPTGDGGAVGIQSDPGTAGDGVTMFPGPYSTPPEAAGLLNGAQPGHLTPSALYASKTVYPGLKFQYSIYTPAGYQKGKPAALMIILDAREWVTLPGSATTIAWTNQGMFNAVNIFDNLIHSGDMPVTVAAFLDPGTTTGQFTNQTGIRSTEYDTPNDNYSKFTLNEFLPDVVFPNYDVVQDPDGWCGMGHSSGGIAVFMMAFFNPDKFHKALTFDASFPNTGGVFPAKITTSPTLPIRVNLLSGPNDLGGGWYSTNTQAAMDLMAKGYHYRFIVEQSMHFPSPAAEQDLPNALRWMWRGYKLPWYP